MVRQNTEAARQRGNASHLSSLQPGSRVGGVGVWKAPGGQCLALQACTFSDLLPTSRRHLPIMSSFLEAARVKSQGGPVRPWKNTD